MCLFTLDIECTPIRAAGYLIDINVQLNVHLLEIHTWLLNKKNDVQLLSFESDDLMIMEWEKNLSGTCTCNFQ